MNTRSLLTVSLVAGAVMAILSHTPVIYLGNCLLCMWVWSSGILGAWLYRRKEGFITAGQGAVIGIFSGLAGTILGTILGAIFGVGVGTILSTQADSAEGMLGSLFGSFALAGSLSVMGVLCNIVIYPTFGAIGGAIGGVIFGSSSVPKAT